jgi:hypothetical protein
MDVTTNGNLLIAVGLVQTNGAPRTGAKRVDIGAAAKAPFRYFGEVYQFSGSVAIIQEYAPGSPTARGVGGGEVSEVVLFDNTLSSMVPIDYLMLGNTGNVKEGDTVTVWGYIVGLIDAKNRLGGTTSELTVVGKEIQATR